MRITESRLRQIIHEEVKAKLTRERSSSNKNLNLLVRRQVNKLVDEGIFDTIFGKNKGKPEEKKEKQSTRSQQSREDRSLSAKEAGEILGTIDKEINKLAMNAKKEQMPDVATKIKDAGDEFLDDVKDSGMMATQDYSKKDMFSKKKKFKGIPEKKSEVGTEDVVTSTK